MLFVPVMLNVYRIITLVLLRQLTRKGIAKCERCITACPNMSQENPP